MGNKVLVVDDHEIFRNGVIQLLKTEENCSIVGDAEDAYQAIEMAEQLKPDVILMDISMPRMNGIEAAQQILKKQPKVKIFFFSLYDKEEYIVKAIKMGAYGYILKDESNKVLLKAIRKVIQGEYYFSGDISNTIIKNLSSVSGNAGTANSSKETLHISKRETQILTELSQGKTNAEISEMFQVSIRTIETHRQNIMRKLQASSIENAISIAKMEDLI